MRLPGFRLALAFLACGVADPAEGLEAPPTARAASRGVPVELLDDDANAFRFPHLAIGAGQALTFHGASGTGASGSSLELAFGGHALGYRARIPPRNALLSQFTSPSYQVSWAHALGSWRLGAAFGWSTQGARRDRDQTYTAGGFNLVSRYDEIETANDREFTLSLSGGETRRIDAAFTLRRRHVEYGWVTAGGPIDQTQYSREQNDVHLDTGFAPALFLRIRPGPHFLLYGSYEEAPFDLEADWRRVVFLHGLVINTEVDAFRSRNAGSAWTVGFRADAKEAWSFHALFDTRRDADWFNGYGTVWRWGRDETSHAEAGFSLERPGPSGFTGRAGVRGFWTRSVDRVRRDEFRIRSVERTDVEVDVSEDLGTRFSWGAGRRFGPVLLDALVATRLGAFDPIVLLDARILL